MYYLQLRTLLKFFLKPILTKIILSNIILTSLLEILSLLEEANIILSRGQGIYGLFYYMILRFPALSVGVIPLSTLIGSLFTLFQMASSSEIAIIKAAGLSTFNIYKILIPGGIFIGLLSTVMQFWLIPPCEKNLSIWWNKTATYANQIDDLPNLWFRDKNAIIYIDKISDGGNFISNISYYNRNDRGSLENIIKIPTLIWKNNCWNINKTQPTIIKITPNKESAYIENYLLPIPSFPAPDKILEMTFEKPFYYPNHMIKMLYNKEASSFPLSNYKIYMLSSLFSFIQALALIFITLPITYLPPRSGIRNPLPIYVMGAGLSEIILQGMTVSLGNAGSLPVIISIISIPFLSILVTLGWILKKEES